MRQPDMVWAMMRDGIITITDETVPDHVDIDDWQPGDRALTLNADDADRLIAQLSRLVTIQRSLAASVGIAQDAASSDESAPSAAGLPSPRLPRPPRGRRPGWRLRSPRLMPPSHAWSRSAKTSSIPWRRDGYEAERERLQALIDERRDQIRRTELLMMPRNYAGYDHPAPAAGDTPTAVPDSPVGR